MRNRWRCALFRLCAPRPTPNLRVEKLEAIGSRASIRHRAEEHGGVHQQGALFGVLSGSDGGSRGVLGSDEHGGGKND